jgi:hypothetical protein
MSTGFCIAETGISLDRALVSGGDGAVPVCKINKGRKETH